METFLQAKQVLKLEGSVPTGMTGIRESFDLK